MRRVYLLSIEMMTSHIEGTANVCNEERIYGTTEVTVLSKFSSGVALRKLQSKFVKQIVPQQ